MTLDPPMPLGSMSNQRWKVEVLWFHMETARQDTTVKEAVPINIL